MQLTSFLKNLTLASCLLGITSISYAVNSPVGSWQTIDDVSKEPKSIVKITELSNHTLEGKVVKLYKDPGKVCASCTDARKNQPIVGMVVMQGLKLTNPSKGIWSNGEILDPKNGKIYHCNLHVSNNNTELQVRGYIGVPLFGRNQTWVRISDQLN